MLNSTPELLNEDIVEHLSTALPHDVDVLRWGASDKGIRGKLAPLVTIKDEWFCSGEGPLKSQDTKETIEPIRKYAWQHVRGKPIHNLDQVNDRAD